MPYRDNALHVRRRQLVHQLLGKRVAGQHLGVKFRESAAWLVLVLRVRGARRWQAAKHQALEHRHGELVRGSGVGAILDCA